MGLPTAFSSKTKLWFRSKFPYESSFALLQLRHWLFCFDGGIQDTDIAWCMVIMYTSMQYLPHFIYLIIASLVFFGENKKRQE